MNNAEIIEGIFAKMFERKKTHSLGLYKMACEIAYETEEYKVLFMKELKQQIFSCRENMTNIFGKEIIGEIDRLDIKVRKLKRLSILREELTLAKKEAQEFA